MGKSKHIIKEGLLETLKDQILNLKNQISGLGTQKAQALKHLEIQRANLKKMLSSGSEEAIKRARDSLEQTSKKVKLLDQKIGELKNKLSKSDTLLAKIKAGAKDVATGAVKAAKAHPKTALALGAGAALGGAYLAHKKMSQRESSGMIDTLVDQYLNTLQEQVRFKEKVKDKLATEGVGFIAAIIGGPYLIKGAIQAYKNMFDKVHQKCQGLPQNDYNFCMQKAKLIAFNAELGKLRQGLGQCSKAKDPAKCQQQVKNKIANTQFKIKTLRGSIKDALARRKVPEQPGA